MLLPEMSGMPDFISVIVSDGLEYKMLFTKAYTPQCKKFIVSVFEKAAVVETFEFMKSPNGQWCAIKPVPDWIVANEANIALRIERFIGCRN